MPSDPLNVHIDLAALQGNFFRRLQHQLDVTKVLQVGCESVTAEQVAEQKEFGAFVPANGAQLKHEDARAEAQDWLLRGFLRDAIEATGLFLDDGKRPVLFDWNIQGLFAKDFQTALCPGQIREFILYFISVVFR